MAQIDRTTGLVGNTGIKQPVRAATTGNITLSGQQTIDGVACVAGDRVLVKSQTVTADNGIYVVDTGAWSRAKDFNGVYDIVKGTTVFVTDGAGAPHYYRVSTENPITIGTSAITFASAIVNDSSLVSFTQIGTGAVERDAQDKMRECLSVLDFIPIAYHAAIRDHTSAIDVAAYVQAAIDVAKANGRMLFFPSGKYKINSSLLIYTSNTLITVSMHGEHFAGVNGAGAVIDHSAIPTTPGLMVQGMRTFMSEGLQYIGPNTYTTTIHFDETDFIVGGVRNSQYSPQAAIVVDPFTSAVPSDGGYPGYTAYYTANALASSRLIFRDTRLKNQLGGIVLGPSGGVNNVDNIEIQNVIAEQCKHPVTISHLNSKSVNIENLYADQAYTVLDTWVFGGRNGGQGFHWRGGDITRSTYLLRTLSQNGAAGAIANAWSIRDVYAESIWSLGFVGDVAGYSYVPGKFDGCTFWFSSSDVLARKDAHLVNFAPLTFEDCAINSNDSAGTIANARCLKIYHGSPANQDTRNLLTFRECTFQGDWGVLFNTDNLHHVRMYGCNSRSPFFRYSYSQEYFIRSLADLTPNQGVWPGALIYDATTKGVLQVPQGMNSAALGAINFTKGTFTGTFTAADAETLQDLDVVYITNHPVKGIDGATFVAAEWPLGIVASMVGADITLRDISESASSGVKTMSLKWYPLVHGYSLLQTTSGTKNVVITQSTVSTPANWEAPRRIISANLPAGTYLTGGVYPNMTVSKNATATASGVECYDANLT
jgi:hypothetical protein